MTTWWGKQNVSSQKRAFKAANEQVLEAENYFSPKKITKLLFLRMDGERFNVPLHTKWAILETFP